MITDFEEFRKKESLNQQEVADNLGITRQTYSKMEKGNIELTLGQAIKLSELLNIDIEELFGSDISTIPTKKTDLEKYKQIISYCIDNGTSGNYKMTKTKLAKLCYLADFGWYYNNLESLTGLKYRRIQQGPVPDAFFRMIDELIEEESISLEVEGKSHLISNISFPKSDKLCLEEKSFINKICEKWKYSNTKEIVDFTHNQLPWMICKEYEIIPYNLITQEEVDNVY